MAVKRKSQIDDKDLSDDIAKILTDQLDALRNQLMQTTYSSLLLGLDLTPAEWYNQHLANRNTLKKEMKGITRQGLSKIINSANNGLDMLELEPKQTSSIKKIIKAEVNSLNSLVLSNYDTILTGTMLTATKVLKSGVTDSLYEIIQKKITETNDYGIKYYKNGRAVRWENYMEMKVRTDIQNDIGKNMVAAGLENGVVFYICSYHGDCAPDHKDYQGKIYVDKNWKQNINDVKLQQQIQSYINNHSVKTIQEIMGPDVYLSTRPNCRHYFQYISIDEVLNIKNDSDLNSKREELNLNSVGKYKPEKYEALKKQRYNERQIRKIKGRIEAKEKIISAFNGGSSPETILKENSELTVLKMKLRDAQKNQRNLLKANPGVLVRNYNREAYSRMISDFRIEKPLSLKKVGASGILKVGELNRSKSANRSNIRPISEERFNKLMIKVSKKGVTYIRGTEWAERHLDTVGAAASNIGTILVFRKDVTLSEVLEETYHVEQNLLGLNDDKSWELRTILNEIDAKEYLLKVAKKYRIPRYEIEETQKQLELYKKQLSEYKEK